MNGALHKQTSELSQADSSYFKHVHSPSQKLAMAYFLEVTDNYPHHDEKDFKCKLIEVFFL